MTFGKMALAGAVFALAGCESVLTSDVIDALPGGVSPAATSAKLFSGAVTVQGPNGFCVDPDSSRPTRGFAILAPCATLGVKDAAMTVNAIVTVQVGEAGSEIVSANPRAFADYLQGENGPFVLSRSGEPETVTVGEVRVVDQHVAVYLRDRAPAHIEGAQEEEWRAFLDLAGRLLTISVRGLDEAPLSNEGGKSLLEQAIKAMIVVNSAADT